MQIKVSAGKAGVNSLSLSAVLMVLSVLCVLFLALYNLTDYPLTWYDEGSHLHVPKTLLRFGEYADYSSEGYRYYGPTIGVGPTVLLPVAGVFKIFGAGLAQARLVIVIYLLATIVVFYRLADQLGGRRLAWVAVAARYRSRFSLAAPGPKNTTTYDCHNAKSKPTRMPGTMKTLCGAVR